MLSNYRLACIFVGLLPTAVVTSAKFVAHRTAVESAAIAPALPRRAPADKPAPEWSLPCCIIFLLDSPTEHIPRSAHGLL